MGALRAHKADSPHSPIDNAAIAELLARKAEESPDTLRRACKRAARAAFLWPEEAGELARRGESLTQLAGIGPYLERVLLGWIEEPPAAINPPPIRSGFLTLTTARQLLASKPEWQKKYRGDLQMHSRWSDGAGTILEMAEAAQARDYSYIGITDHSKGLKIAGGIDEVQLTQQAEEIAQINADLKRQGGSFHVIRSIEMNLKTSGEGDLDKRALRKLDLVVGSFHSKLREREEQTERYLAALQNHYVDILGHPRGRIYNHRLGLTADWARVFACAARLDKAVEIDAYPDRHDLNLELLKVARREGAPIAIDTDAHSPAQLDFVELGLAAALKAGISSERIINFMPLNSLLAWATSN